MGMALVALLVMNVCQRSYTLLATEGLPGSTKKLKHFNYKGDWMNAWRRI